MDSTAARGRAAHPDLEVDAAAFVAHLEALAGAEAIEDLYLAFAAANGVPLAIERVAAMISALRPALGKLGLGASDQDEALQLVRAELLTGPAKIAGYSGRGSLEGWLRSVVVRKGLRLIEQRPRAQPLGELPASISDDIELAYLKRTYGEAFRSAFQRAIDSLPVEDRLLLKQRFRHALGVVELGALHGVNPGTISRRVAATCRRLADATRAIMTDDLGIARTEMSSVMRLIESQLEITLSAL